jgi:hypothetical protein
MTDNCGHAPTKLEKTKIAPEIRNIRRIENVHIIHRFTAISIETIT